LNVIGREPRGGGEKGAEQSRELNVVQGRVQCHHARAVEGTSTALGRENGKAGAADLCKGVQVKKERRTKWKVER